MTKQLHLWTNYGLKLKTRNYDQFVQRIDWIQWLQIQQKFINEIKILMMLIMGFGHVCKLNYINLNQIAVIGNPKHGTQTE